MDWNILTFGLGRKNKQQGNSFSTPVMVRPDEQAIVFDWIEDKKLLKDEAILTTVCPTTNPSCGNFTAPCSPKPAPKGCPAHPPPHRYAL